MTGGLHLRNIYIFSPINVSHLFSTSWLVETKSHSTERIAFFSFLPQASVSQEIISMNKSSLNILSDNNDAKLACGASSGRQLNSACVM